MRTFFWFRSDRSRIHLASRHKEKIGCNEFVRNAKPERFDLLFRLPFGVYTYEQTRHPQYTSFAPTILFFGCLVVHEPPGAMLQTMQLLFQWCAANLSWESIRWSGHNLIKIAGLIDAKRCSWSSVDTRPFVFICTLHYTSRRFQWTENFVGIHPSNKDLSNRTEPWQSIFLFRNHTVLSR